LVLICAFNLFVWFCFIRRSYIFYHILLSIYFTLSFIQLNLLLISIYFFLLQNFAYFFCFQLVNTSFLSSAVGVSFKALDGNSLVASALSVSGKPVTMAIPNPKIWDPTSPFLYNLQISITGDSISSYFGLRSVSLVYLIYFLHVIFVISDYSRFFEFNFETRCKEPKFDKENSNFKKITKHKTTYINQPNLGILRSQRYS
jgi:hypothetical protein